MVSPSRILNNITPEEEVKRETRTVTGMTDVSKTLFLPLFFRAQETLENGIVNDPAAVKLIHRLGYDNHNFRLDREMQLIISLRTVVLDRIVGNYIRDMRAERHQPVIINIGAGLDTREQRFPDAVWYQVDLDAPISLRKQYIADSNAITIAGSAFEEDWVRQVQHHDHVLVIVEGVLMYFNETMVKRFFDILSRHFRHFWVAFDALAKRYTTVRVHQSIDVNKAGFKWGIGSAKDIEDWQMGYQAMSDYGYYQEYLNHYEHIAGRYRMIRFDATHKVYVVSHNE